MRVECTDYWWQNKTLHKKGDVVEVPDGTPVPSGFIVNGKATPSRAEKHAQARQRTKQGG